MKRKICAVLVALGMILCQIPQTVAASEDVTAAGEAVPVVETVEAAQAAEETEIPSEPEEQYAEAGTAAPEVAAQTDGESGTTESNEAHEPSGNVEEAGAKAPEEKAVTPDGGSSKNPVSESGTEKTPMPKTSAGADAGLVGAPKSVSDLTPVDSVVVGVVVPHAGDTTESAPRVFALDSGYHITTANWCDEEGNELGSTVTFAAGETYYIKASASSEEGYFFRQGSDGTSFEAEGGELKSSWIMNWTDVDGGAHSYAEIIIAVRVAAQTSFFGVLISDAEGTANKGGTYWMDYAGMEGSPSRTSSSNNFVEDGSDVYLEAYPADGYKFLGWYQGDPDRAEGKPYTGEPLTTDSVYEFDAPIILTRPYICAVFDVDESPQGDQVQMWVGNTEVIGPDSSAQGGKVAVKYEPSYDIYPDITAKDGTNFVAGEILPFYKGDECTVYQQADEGFHFVGWYHVNIEWGPGETLAWEGSPISTADSFTYKPGQTVVAGDSEPLRYVCAVFEKNQAVTHTVSFDPGTGYGEMKPYTVDDGESFTPPECTFSHSNPDRVFYKWAVDGKYLSLGESFTVTKDTVVKAVWHYREIQRLDNSVDRSVTDVVGHLILRDTRTGEERTEVVFDEVTASAFTEPSNVTVNAMITEAKEAAAKKAGEYAGESAVKTVSETVSDPAIKDFKDDRTYTYFTDGQDSAGDVYTLMIIDGGYLHSWQYDVTLVAEYTSVDPSTATITLHWSSADGVDLMQPISIETKPGTRLDDALTAAGQPYDDIFSKDGYADFGYRSLHPFDSFSDENDFYDDCIGYDYVIENSTDIYVVMFKELGAASISVATPVCGSTDAPAVSVLTGECILDGTPVWCEDADPLVPYEGALKGGIQYLAAIQLDADFHYYLADDAQITVSGGELVSAGPHFAGIGVLVRVAVDHDPDDPVRENVVEPTCTEPGSHDEVVYCKGCGAEISRTEVTDPALGHDWGAWEITKEPTETEDGEETRTCTRCPEKETRAIPHLSVEYRNTEGDGSSREKGSTESLRFVFKRNVNDETAFSHFTGILVDGKAADTADYTAESGSVIINLKPAYLETLSKGEHSLTAMFDDYDDVTVRFTVTEKEAAPADGQTDKKDTPKKDTPKTDTQKSGTQKTGSTKTSGTSAKTTAKKSPKTGDNTNAVVWAVLLTAAAATIGAVLMRRRRNGRS